MKKFSLILTILLSAAAQAEDCKVFDQDFVGGDYQGSCKNGLAHGYATVTGATSYRGDFAEGKKHGKGIKTYANGDVYAGEFDNDYRHGKGSYVWGKKTPWYGDRYEGQYQRDLRHGWGVFYWNSGDRYEGPWENDLRMAASPMEGRRHQASLAAAKVMQVGVQVCTHAMLGFSQRQQLRGKIEALTTPEKPGTAPEMQVRLSYVEGNQASFKNVTVKSGDVVQDTLLNWQLCAAE